MLLQGFHRRTAELIAQFRADVAIDISALSLDEIERLRGFAKNTVLLLRENKTRCVREEQARGVEVAEFSAVKQEIDEAINEVLAKRVELTHASAPLLVAEPTPVTQEVDLTDRLVALAELRRAGVLTEAEFSKAKATLL